MPSPTEGRGEASGLKGEDSSTSLTANLTLPTHAAIAIHGKEERQNFWEKPHHLVT